MAVSKNLAEPYKFLKVSWKLLGFVTLVSAVGVLLVYSAANGNMEPWALKQVNTILFIVPVVILLCLVDTYLIYRYSYFLYFICLMMLIASEFVGYKAMGAQRWLRFGPINIQPAEFMKLAVILSLSRYFHLLHSNQVQMMKSLVPPILMVIVPVVLVLRQPNLGTSMIILTISISIFFAAGVRIWKFIAAGSIATCAIPVLWYFMKPYQKRRVLTFLNPEMDPLGAGYNIIQSKIAIGSGGLLGKGFLEGTQNQLNFLPENQTDFIFTLLAEEFGFVGVVVLISAYFIICLYCYYVAFNCNNQFSRLSCIGVSTMLFVHIFVNLGMVSGMLPVVGITAPFLSWGRSSMIASFLAIGVVLNAKAHKDFVLMK